MNMEVRKRLLRGILYLALVLVAFSVATSHDGLTAGLLRAGIFTGLIAGCFLLTGRLQ